MTDPIAAAEAAAAEIETIAQLVSVSQRDVAVLNRGKGHAAAIRAVIAELKQARAELAAIKSAWGLRADVVFAGPTNDELSA